MNNQETTPADAIPLGSRRSRAAIHQLVHTLSYGDAISTEVIAIQRSLIDAGFESIIFAINVHPFYRSSKSTAAGPIAHYETLPRAAEVPIATASSGVPGALGDHIILHYSLGSRLNDLYRTITGYRRSLVYHNLTPAHFFAGINPRLVRHLTSGAQELPELCDLSDALIADSQFNADDLAAISAHARRSGVAILPLLVEPSRFNPPANVGFAALLQNTRGINVLHVGRLVPNKGYEQIIRSFYFLRMYIDPRARLWLVGTDIDSEIYGYALKRMCDAWGLSPYVEFLGQRSDDEVRALYENCSVYLCLSEHEGFCLPIIEAMHFGLPVISTTHGALAETLGDGGILIDRVVPSLVAELVAEVCQNQELREQVRVAGRVRAAAFGSDRFYARVAEIFFPNERAAAGTAIGSTGKTTIRNKSQLEALPSQHTAVGIINE